MISSSPAPQFGLCAMWRPTPARACPWAPKERRDRPGPPSSGVEDRVCQRFDVAPTGTPDSRRRPAPRPVNPGRSKNEQRSIGAVARHAACGIDARAGARGVARGGSPRCSRVRSMTALSRMAAITFSSPHTATPGSGSSARATRPAGSGCRRWPGPPSIGKRACGLARHPVAPADHAFACAAAASFAYLVRSLLATLPHPNRRGTCKANSSPRSFCSAASSPLLPGKS